MKNTNIQSNNHLHNVNTLFEDNYEFLQNCIKQQKLTRSSSESNISLLMLGSSTESNKLRKSVDNINILESKVNSSLNGNDELNNRTFHDFIHDFNNCVAGICHIGLPLLIPMSIVIASVVTLYSNHISKYN